MAVVARLRVFGPMVTVAKASAVGSVLKVPVADPAVAFSVKTK